MNQPKYDYFITEIYFNIFLLPYHISLVNADFYDVMWCHLVEG